MSLKLVPQQTQFPFKMISLYYLTAAVFFMCCSTTTFAEGNLTSRPRNNTSNGGNSLPACKLHVSKPEIHEVLRLQYNSTTNTVKMKITVVSGNEPRDFPEMTWLWASEIGRTIISLVRLAKDTIFASPIFTSVLEIGTEEVDIEITEKPVGCLPPGDEGADRIFDFLLHQLSHSDDTPVYKMCRVHDDESQYATYNCCRITRNRNLIVCADYSSVVVNFALPVVIGVFLVSFYMVLPFVLEYTYNMTDTIINPYKTSGSHMSLISIVSLMLFQGSEPAVVKLKSFFRRCLFAGLSSLVFPRDFFGLLWLEVLFCLWAAGFVLSYDVQTTSEENERKYAVPKWSENIIHSFTIPFNLLFPCIKKIYSHKDKRFEGGNLCCKYLVDLFCCAIICILMILYFSICFPVLVVVCLIKFTFVDLLVFFVRPNDYSVKCKWVKILLVVLVFLIKVLTFANIVFFTCMILNFVLFIVVGLTLNSEYFSPFVVPIFTLLVYFFKNWKFSVETKCWDLKTSIIEVCKQKILLGEDENVPEDFSVKARSNNELTCKDRLFDFLCPCIRDTSKDSHTWRSLKNSCMCCTKDDPQGGNASETVVANTSSDESLNKKHGASEDNESTQTWKSLKNLCSCCTKGASSYENFKYEGGSAVKGNKSTKNDGQTEHKGNEDNKLTIKFDELGEAKISKELYETVSEKILPLEHLLFYFFRRVIFVGLYAFVMFTVMILGRESGVSGSVQVVGAIGGALVPFLFGSDTNLSEKTARIMATKERLELIIKFDKRENNTFFFKFTKKESHKDQQGERRQSGIDDTSL